MDKQTDRQMKVQHNVYLAFSFQTLLYNGQLDVIVGAPLTERYLTVLPWSGLQQYLKTERMVWRIGDDVAGYVRQVESFMQVCKW